MWPIESTISGATIPSQSGPGRDVNKGILCIPESSSISRSSPSRTLIGFGEVSHSSAEMQSVYSAAPADWVNIYRNTGNKSDCTKCTDMKKNTRFSEDDCIHRIICQH